MNTYRIRFSVRTLTTTVHADSCASATFYRPSRPRALHGLQMGVHKSGDSLWQVHAETAKAAADAQDAEFVTEEREMPATIVCNCCKE